MFDGEFAFSFVLGAVAAINPCGFVMLPAYLAFFLGHTDDEPIAPARRIGRALRVGAAVSVGFITVFLVVGVLVRTVDLFDGLPGQARWAGLVIGITMATAGVAMLLGWSPQMNTAAIARRNDPRDRTTLAMFGFGLAYAIASIGCTIGLFLAVVIGTFTRNGFASGVVSTVAYGAGMGSLVTTVTVALAFAKTGLPQRLRRYSRHVHALTATIVLLSGLYIAWYWYGAIFRPFEPDPITTAFGTFQVNISSRLERFGATTLAITMGSVLAAAIVAVSWKRLTRHRTRD